MSEPNFIIRESDKTDNGSLTTHQALMIKDILKWGNGYVLLPSDTCYSIGATAVKGEVHDNINTMLDRKEDPMSIAFPNFNAAKEWTQLDPLAATLLEFFTPGPITVVCRAASKIPLDFTREGVKSTDRTIGVRIPDSKIERDIASITGFPITTVAVRDREKKAVKDFQEALSIVGEGMEKIGNPDWAAVEGSDFLRNHSTVVYAAGGKAKMRLIRAGDLPFGDIREAVKHLPSWQP